MWVPQIDKFTASHLLVEIHSTPLTPECKGFLKFQNLQTIKYIKRYGNEEWHYIEAVNENKKKLWFVSLRIDERKIK